MGLEFGFYKLPKELWNSFNGNKTSFYDYFIDNEEHQKDLSYLNTWCGRGNPIEDWFREGLEYYSDYNGVLMRALAPKDLYAVIKEAKRWYDNHIDLKPVVMGKGFKEDYDNDNLTLMPIDGIEVMDEDQAYHRFYAEDSDGRLFITKDWVNPWDIYKFTNFIDEIMDILLTFDWENNVLLYFVSY